MLTDLLKPELVACHVEASDWEERSGHAVSCS